MPLATASIAQVQRSDELSVDEFESLLAVIGVQKSLNPETEFGKHCAGAPRDVAAERQGRGHQGEVSLSIAPTIDGQPVVNPLPYIHPRHVYRRLTASAALAALTVWICQSTSRDNAPHSELTSTLFDLPSMDLKGAEAGC